MKSRGPETRGQRDVSTAAAIKAPKARRSYIGLTIFPDDENGRVLRDIEARGDDLTKARDIDFTVVFAQASSAEQFAEHFRELGYAVSVRGITDFENELQLVADRWDGHNDGWGFFSEPIATA